MNENPLVSVIINCYNGEEFLRETIESVINQTYSNWELIFWDNQSTDSTAEIIKGYHDDRIRYFYAPTHTPLGEARNLAMKQVAGKYLAFLDSDDIWYPDFLKTGIDILEEEVACAGFYSNFHYYNEKGILCNFNNNKERKFYDFRLLLLEYKMAMSGSIIRSDVVRRNGIVFNKKYNLIEDYDFFLAISRKGLWIYHPEPLVYYRIHLGQTSSRLIEQWAIEYKCIYDELYSNFVKKGLLEKADLNVLHNMYCEAKFGSIIRKGQRSDILQLMKEETSCPFRFWIKCIIFFLLGSNFYIVINYFRKLKGSHNF